jgi:hypothetical protein
MRERLDIRIDAELRAWLVATAEAESRTMTHIVERALCVERHNAGHGITATRSAPIGKLIDTATGLESPVRRPPTKQELDLQRQQKLNAKKKGSAT